MNLKYNYSEKLILFDNVSNKALLKNIIHFYWDVYLAMKGVPGVIQLESK